MIVRCTNKLLQLLEARAASLVQAPPTEDDWYANLLWLDRRKCLLLTHDGTLFSVFTADVLKRDLQPFGVYLVWMIEARLREEHLPIDALGELDPDSVRLARTASRSVLGFMNDMAQACRYQVEASGGLAVTDVEALNRRLLRTLHNREGYHDPLELVARRIGAR
ncbi:MAG: DUF6933 domain-containing protein [Actinomycetota bacterium]